MLSLVKSWNNTVASSCNDWMTAYMMWQKSQIRFEPTAFWAHGGPLSLLSHQDGQVWSESTSGTVWTCTKQPVTQSKMRLPVFYTHAYTYIWHAPAYLCVPCVCVCVCVCVYCTNINSICMHGWMHMHRLGNVSFCLSASYSVCELMQKTSVLAYYLCRRFHDFC